MRVKYWTIQAHPHGAALHSSGVGVLGISEDDNRRKYQSLRLIGNNRPLPLPDSVAETVRSGLEAVKDSLYETSPSNDCVPMNVMKPLDEETIETMRAEWNGIIRLDPPRTIVADSMDEAMTTAFNMFIAPVYP